MSHAMMPNGRLAALPKSYLPQAGSRRPRVVRGNPQTGAREGVRPRPTGRILHVPGAALRGLARWFPDAPKPSAAHPGFHPAKARRIWLTVALYASALELARKWRHVSLAGGELRGNDAIQLR